MSKIVLLTCTKDRPGEMQNLLNSVRAQLDKPDLHIVIDGSDHPEKTKSVIDQYPELNIQYQTLRPPGLTRQKNLGISLLPSDTDWVGVLDDDVVLNPETIKNIRDHIAQDDKVKGIGLVFHNQTPRSPSLFRRLFLLDGATNGSFTTAGVPASVHSVENNVQMEWLHGGATFWHSTVFKEFTFDEWFSGIGYFEDIDFSYHVSRKYPLILQANALCSTYENDIPKSKLKLVGTWQIVSWWYFVNKTKDFNKIAVLYSMLALTIINFITGIIRPKTNRILNGLGNLKGLAIVLSGKTNAHQGFQK